MMREISHGNVDQFGALEAWLKKHKDLNPSAIDLALLHDFCVRAIVW